MCYQTDEYVAETIEQDEYRARVILDVASGDFKPDGCWFGTVFGGDHGYFETLGADSCVGAHDINLNLLWSEFMDWNEIERVLRGELNKCALCYEMLVRDDDGDWMVPNDAHDPVDGDDYRQCMEADPDDPYAWGHELEFDYSELNVVGFDVRHTGHGTVLVNVVTLRDLNHWGWDSLESYNARFSGVDPAYSNLDDWVAWAEGDVYYVVIERDLERHVKLYDGEGIEVEDNRDRIWSEVDACHGFYGTEYATEYATSLVNQYAGN